MALALAAGSCGGDDGESTGGSAPASFEADFSATCGSVAEQVDDLPEPVGFESLAEVARQAGAVTAEGVSELEGITPPAAIETRVRELLDGLDAQSDAFGELASAADEGDRESVEAANAERLAAGTRLSRLAADIGLDCDVALMGGSGSSFEPPPQLDPDDAAPPELIPGFGDDPDLDALARACAVGDAESCDLLGLSGPAGSGYEDYGGTCGGRNESLIEDPGTFCVDRYR